VFEPELDEEQKARFQMVKDVAEKVIPEGCLLEGFVLVPIFLSAEGESQHMVYYDHDQPYPTTVGHLEIAKYHLLTRFDEDAE
jgi:hypothetical protein